MDEKEKELVKWARSSFHLTPKEGESTEAFLCRFSWYMLNDQNDPLIAAEILLGKTHNQWSPLECARWVLDYEEWMETNPHSYKFYSTWCAFKEMHQNAINQLIFIERRRAEEVTSNPVECTTLEGRHAADVGKWDPSRQGHQTHWDRNILKEPPHGYEEAILKRERFPVDDPDQGHLLVRHFDKGGDSRVRQIVPKGQLLSEVPSLVPRPDRTTLAQSEREGKDVHRLADRAGKEVEE